MASVDDLWIVDFGDPFPGEPAEHRPALILGPPSRFGPGFPYVIVAPLTTTFRRLNFHVEIDASESTGLDQTSHVQCELIRSVSARRLVHRIGAVDPIASEAVDDVIRTLLGH